METVKTFLVEIVCPSCGHTGTAHASSRDLPTKDTPTVSLDQIPFGFTLAQAATATSEPSVKCQCGNVFEPPHH